MTEIRPLELADLPAVGSLLDAHLPGWGGDREFVKATVLDHPWADPEVGSLVALADDGEVIGFIGAQARRIRFDGRDLRGVCCSHLVVAPDSRAGAAGALLLSRLLKGPQDLTFSDSAIPIVARIWRTFGGHVDHARVCDWMLVLRPAAWLGSWGSWLVRRRKIDRSLIPVGAFPFQAWAGLRPGRGTMVWEDGELRRASDLNPGVSGEDASTDEILAQLPALSARTRLRVDYDKEYLDDLFAKIRSHSGELVCRVVKADDRPIGWYCYLPRLETASRVLHIAGPETDIDLVVGELVDHARGRGSRVIAGRLEPHLDAPLRRRLAAVGLVRESVLHARDPELRAVLGTGAALLTQLDSEWFLV